MRAVLNIRAKLFTSIYGNARLHVFGEILTKLKVPQCTDCVSFGV